MKYVAGMFQDRVFLPDPPSGREGCISFVYYHMVRYIILCTMYTEFVGTNISDPFLIYEVGSGSKTRVIYSSYT